MSETLAAKSSGRAKAGKSEPQNGVETRNSPAIGSWVPSARYFSRTDPPNEWPTRIGLVSEVGQQARDRVPPGPIARIVGVRHLRCHDLDGRSELAGEVVGEVAAALRVSRIAGAGDEQDGVIGHKEGGPLPPRVRGPPIVAYARITSRLLELAPRRGSDRSAALVVGADLVAVGRIRVPGLVELRRVLDLVLRAVHEDAVIVQRRRDRSRRPAAGPSCRRSTGRCRPRDSWSRRRSTSRRPSRSRRRAPRP